MRTIAILFILVPFFHSHAQNNATKALGFYCAPCGCKYDDTTFNAAGKCPDCKMTLLKSGTYNYEGASVSSNGQLAYTSNKKNNKKLTYYRPLNSPEAEQVLDAGGMPLLSKDGKKILMEAEGNKILIYNLATNSKTTIGPELNLSNLQTPSWDHEYKNIFFCAGDFPKIGIYLYDVKERSVKPLLTDSAMRYGVRASPDGKMIAYRCAKGNPEKGMTKGIAVYNLTTGEEKHITTIGEYPTWSPDSKRLAFHWTNQGAFSIYTVNADGTDLKQLTETGNGSAELPSWSFDGKKIYFQTNRRQGNWEIWTMDVDGKDQKPLIF